MAIFKRLKNILTGAKMPTQKQLDYARVLGITVDGSMNREDVSKEISKRSRFAPPMQDELKPASELGIEVPPGISRRELRALVRDAEQNRPDVIAKKNATVWDAAQRGMDNLSDISAFKGEADRWNEEYQKKVAKLISRAEHDGMDRELAALGVHALVCVRKDEETLTVELIHDVRAVFESNGVNIEGDGIEVEEEGGCVSIGSRLVSVPLSSVLECAVRTRP